MATQLTQTARAAADKMKEQVINNLRKRSKIGQRVLISRVDYRLGIDEANNRYLFRFEFGRVAPERIFRGKNVSVIDPLFGKIKPWVKTKREAAFTRKLNVYEKLQNQYLIDAANDLIAAAADEARRTILDQILKGNG